MIRHIVLFTAREEKDKDAVYKGLSILKDIPHCLHLEVSLNNRHDPISQISPDVIVYGEFASDEQLEKFKQHELYQQSINIVRPLREMRISADFEANLQ